MRFFNKTVFSFMLVPAMIFASTFVCHGKDQKDLKDEKIIFTGSWEIRGQVNKLYDTPLGAAYDFMLSDYYDFKMASMKAEDKKKLSFHSIQLDLLKIPGRREKLRRFIILDFQARTFPAISQQKTPIFNFTATYSGTDPANINNYLDINGLYRFDPAKELPVFKFSNYAVAPPEWRIAISDMLRFPYYEVTSFRFIFDTSRGGVVSSNFNGQKTIAPHMQPAVLQCRSLGICVQINETTPRIPYRQIIELSLPQITLTDREEVLRDLPPVAECADYPYAGYAEELRKVKMSDKPDLLYAFAMRFLDGQDLPLGIELLQKAAARKHLLAMYQLGVCYYRGIGVEPDLKKSLEWLKQAADYGLPDAWALYGVVLMRSSKTIYLSDYVISSVKESLDAQKINVEKHDSWVLERLFGDDSGFPWKRYLRCSPKLAFMVEKGHCKDYYKGYYKVEIKPKFKLLEKDEWKIKLTGGGGGGPAVKNPVKFDPGFKKPEKPVKVQGSAPGNPYWMEQEFVPAILYLGRITAQYWDKDKKVDHAVVIGNHVNKIKIDVEGPVDALQKASSLFNRGVRLGSLECETEELLCQARLGNLNREAFSPALDVRLADYPLYYMVKYMVENPDAPGVREYMAMKYEDARKIWSNNPSGWNEFMLGAETLYRYFYYGFDTAWYRLYLRDVKEVETAFIQLDSAARQNIVPALYLSGRQLLEGMRNKSQLDDSGNKSQGVNLLRAAAQAGHIKASYLLIRYYYDLNQTVDEKKWIEAVKPACDVNYADAWLLSGDIYARLKSPGSDKKAFDAYSRAVELGSVRAWYRLGMLYYKMPDAGKEKDQNKSRAGDCWRKFVRLDQETRNQDINDVYWSNISKPEEFKLDDKNHAIGDLTDKEVRRYYETY